MRKDNGFYKSNYSGNTHANYRPLLSRGAAYPFPHQTGKNQTVFLKFEEHVKGYCRYDWYSDQTATRHCELKVCLLMS